MTTSNAGAKSIGMNPNSISADRFANILNSLDEGVEAAQAAIDSIGLGKTIDEVALIFDGEMRLSDFLKSAVQTEGVVLFNYAEDRVETYPIRSQYRVKYWFLTTPRGYRMELMTIEPGRGHSPLHSAFMQQRSYDNLPVHFSFKCFDEGEYEKARKTIEANEWTLAQNNHSTYGSFAYYLTGETTDYELEKQNIKWSNSYIKPRVNTRDSYPKTGIDESNA